MSEAGSSSNLFDRLAYEFAERYRKGERPPITEYTSRYPELAEQIQELFPALVVMEEFGSVDAQATGPFGKVLPSGEIPQQLGEYRILREIARGGMGIVFEAVQESLGRHVALKVLPFHKMLHGNQLERFRREARAAANLHHTNIVPVFGIGECEGIHYYAMQFIQGQTLDCVLREVKRLRHAVPLNYGSKNEGSAQPDRQPQAVHNGDPTTSEGGELSNLPVREESTPSGATVGKWSSSLSQSSGSEWTTQPDKEFFQGVARVGVQIAEALSYAHSQGILHRDIKPANLLLDTQGTVWVADFGLAKAEGVGELTNPGDIVGTLRYMAPERFNGISDVRSDVYSLGLTLYEMLTLQPAFLESNRVRLIKQISTESPPRPRSINANIPPDLETIVCKAMAQDPDHRYPTAAALAEDLRRFAAGLPILARRVSWAEQIWRWCQRNRTVAGLTAGVVTLSLMITVALALIGVLQQARNTALINQHLAEERRKEVEEANEKIQTLLNRAVNAEQENKIREHLAKAASIRRKMNLGQRLQARAEIQQAVALKPRGDLVRQLRNEVIAGLALCDVQVFKEWKGWPVGTAGFAFDSNLSRYVRTDLNGKLTLRRTEDDAELDQVIDGSGFRFSPQFSPDGKYLVVYGDYKVKVYHIGKNKLEYLFQVPPNFNREVGHAVHCGDISGINNQLILGFDDGSIGVYDLATGTQTKRFSPDLAFEMDPALGKAIQTPVKKLSCHPTLGQVAVIYKERGGVFDLAQGKLIVQVPIPKGGVTTAGWNPRGTLLALAGADRVIHLWDRRSHKQIASLEGHKSGNISFRFHPAGDLLISNDDSNLLRFWDLRTGKILLSFPSYHYPIHFSQDGVRLGPVGTMKSQTQILEFVDNTSYKSLAGTGASLSGPFATPSVDIDNRLLVVGMPAGFGCWDLDARDTIAHVPCKGVNPNLVCSTSLQSSTLLVQNDSGVSQWPIRRNNEQPSTINIGPVKSLFPAWFAAPLVSQSGNGKVIVFNSLGGLHLRQLDQPNKVLTLGKFMSHVALNNTGTLAATGSVGVTIWNVGDGKILTTLVPNLGGCSCWFSPDGNWLAVRGFGETGVWKVGAWKSQFRLETGPSKGTAFSHDSKILAVETGHGIILLLDPATGKEYARLENPFGDPANHLCFSPDGTRLIATDNDNMFMYVWDLRTVRRELLTLGLDWDLPPFVSARRQRSIPLTIQILAEKR